MEKLSSKNMNTEAAISNYLHAKANEMRMPLNATFELTNRCNFDCKMCYVHTAQCNLKADELSAEWWIDTAKQAAEAGVLFLLLTGGEPLLREDFPKIYKELKKLGFVITINTNGYFLQGEIARLLEEDPPCRINVSLYGASDDAYEKLTGRRAFSTVIENIKEMRSYGIDVRLNCSVTSENADEMEKIFELSKQLDMHIKTTPYMFPPLRAKGVVGENSSRLTPQKAAECRVRLSLLKYGKDEFIDRARGMSRGISMYTDECLDENEAYGVRCRAGKSSFWVTNKGIMSPCGMVDKGFDLKQMRLSEAWQKVLDFTSKITLPKKCANCKYRHFCNVCAAVCYTETGDFSQVPEYVCCFSEETARQTQIECERLEKEL